MKEKIMGILEAIVLTLTSLIFIGAIALVGGCILGTIFEILF